MRLKTSIAALLVLCSTPYLSSQDQIGLDLQIRMTTVRRSGPPELFYRTVLFSYQSRSFVRYVGAAFDFEDYQKVHVYRRNEHGIFLLPFGPPDTIDSIKYRLVVDGLWIADPTNPNTMTDERGNTLSLLTLALPPVRTLRSPTLARDGTIEFSIRHKPDSKVFLTGDFTNWEPFMIQMDERTEGIYTISINLAPGNYEYCFIVDGLRMLDPLNHSYGADSHGYLASRFIVSRRTSR